MTTISGSTIRTTTTTAETAGDGETGSTGKKMRLLSTTVSQDLVPTSAMPGRDTTTTFVTLPWWKSLWILIRQRLFSAPAFPFDDEERVATYVWIPHYTWTDRVKNLLWAILATVTGSFIVAILYRTQLMERASTGSVYLLSAAAIMAAVAAALIFGRTAPEGGAGAGQGQ